MEVPFMFNYSSYFTKAVMKIITVVVPPNLLNILLKKITPLSLPTFCVLTIFTATAKQSLFTDSLFQCKKEMKTWMIRFQRGQDWDQAFHKYLMHSSSTSTPIKHFQSVILTKHPTRIFFLSLVPHMNKIWKSFRIRESKNTEYGKWKGSAECNVA